MKITRKVLFIAILVGGFIAVSFFMLASENKSNDDPFAQAQLFKWMSDGRSFLGVSLEEVNAETAKKYGLKDEYGALVIKIAEDSAAEKAGLKKDDIIVEWNNDRVESAAQLKRLVNETPAGRKVRLGLIREGKATTIDVTLQEQSSHSLSYAFERPLKAYEKSLDIFKNELGEQSGKSIFICRGKGRMGVMLQSLTPQLAEYFGLKDRHGILISSVIEDSPAEKAGLRAGDVVVSIDGKEMTDSNDVVKIVEEKEEGSLNVMVIRDKQEKTINVTLEKREKPKEDLMKHDERRIVIKSPRGCTSMEI